MPIEMNELFGIAGKVAVITGAGGVLGGNIAKHFMRQGAKVVAVDIRQEQLDKRVSELKQYGNEVIGVVGDVLDVASLGKLAGQVLSQWGKIDILLNIAGGNMPGATLEPEQHFYDMDIACWEKPDRFPTQRKHCRPVRSQQKQDIIARQIDRYRMCLDYRKQRKGQHKDKALGIL